MKVGDFVLMLHSHIPYCKMAGNWPFGEEWLYEAMSEVYVPLIKMLRERPKANIRFNFSFTPILLEQLADPYIKEKFVNYLDMRANLAKEDVMKFTRESEEKKKNMAQCYLEEYENLKAYFIDVLDRNIISEFKRLQNENIVEITTSSATHAYLPLFKNIKSIEAQIDIGCDTYEKYFEKQAKGIWLPECGFKQELSRVLEKNGIEYFFIDTHSIIESLNEKFSGASDGISVDYLNRDPNIYDAYRAYTLKDSSLKVFVRDAATAVQVWSKDWGYPGDGTYREFHKSDMFSGMKYWRVTSHQTDVNSKELYDSEAAKKRVKVHANHFVDMLGECLKNYNIETGNNGVMVAPFDCELFGHWWHEGIDWLNEVFELLSAQKEISSSTVSSYISSEGKDFTEVDLIESSWGRGGKHDVWLNDQTNWIWDHIYECEPIADQMLDLTRKSGNEIISRIGRQAAREYLLMSASDWPFLITTGQASDYAKQRFIGHYNNFMRLKAMADDIIASHSQQISDETFLSSLEISNSPFSLGNMM